ncbi:MAG TPA: hypothetical protein VK656_00325 [Candidatus Acidoferrum sp.]|nr:hypothetical protein [Candidatus Acidoferrum sp.]
MTSAAEFPAVAARLRAILEPYGDRLIWDASPSGDAKLERLPGGHPWDYIAGIRVGKTYVSYYLMPVYAIPELLAGMSPELHKRMQGKACFNFTRIDEPLFAELTELTATGIERFRDWQPPERKR